jgi:two-component system CheB/CheR fusion protein
VPDVILADYRLGGGDTGNEAIRRLRRALGRHIPGILLTGDTSPDRLSEAERSGFELLHKPIRPAEVVAIVDRLQLSRRSA